MPTDNQKIPRLLPLGLAFITCATLLLEITYTRIFSVTMWYHYAFMTISIALFGMAFGSVIVYLRPNWFSLRTAFRAIVRAGAGVLHLGCHHFLAALADSLSAFFNCNRIS